MAGQHNRLLDREIATAVCGAQSTGLPSAGERLRYRYRPKKWGKLTRVHTEVDMVTVARLLVFVIAVAVLVGSPVARAAEEVDVLLVLSSDVSRSIDAPSFKLQRDGYAAAIVNPRVIQAIRSGALVAPVIEYDGNF